MSDPASKARNAQIANIAADWWRKRAGGQLVSEEAVIAAHPDLMPELAEHLRLLRRMQISQLQAADSGEPEPRDVGQAETELIRRSLADGDAMAPGRDALAVGTLLDHRYVICQQLGQGGMGVVYLAQDRTLGKLVAIKTFAPSVLAQLREQVIAEATLAQRVTHINVCRIYDIKLEHEPAYLTMEYIDGEDLDQTLLRVGRLVPERAFQVSLEICRGLSAAHEQGVIHRDIKPRNIMLDSAGMVRITDFGLARTSYGQEALEIAGTVSYMAPEQRGGQGTSERSDIFALGLVLYEIYAGRLPTPTRRGGRNSPSAIRWVPPSRHVPEIEPRIERVILQCLEAEPKARPQSVLAVINALDGSDKLQPLLAGTAVESTAPVRWMTLAALLGLVLCWLVSAFRPIESVPFGLASPEAYAGKARDVLGELGYRVGWERDQQACGFAYATGFHNQPEAADQAIVFWYRQAAQPLTPSHLLLNRNQVSTRVRADDPAWIEPEMLGIQLTTDGRLREFRSLLPQDASPRDKQTLARELATLFAAARLDFEQYQDWQGVPLGSLDPGLTFGKFSPNLIFQESAGDRKVVFARAQDNRITHFRVSPLAGNPPFDGFLADIFNDVLYLAIAIGAVVGCVLARRNSHAQEIDLHGAKITAALVFMSLVASAVFSANHTNDLHREIQLIQIGLLNALFWSALLWLLYMSLEPFVKRERPQVLRNWLLLTHGHVRNSSVAVHIVGAAMLGILSVPLLGGGHASLRRLLGLPARYGIPPIELPAIENLAGLSAVYFDALANSVYFAFVLVLVPMLLKKVVDDFRVAVCMTWSINSIFYTCYYGGGIEPWWDWGLFLVYMSLWAALHLAVAIRGGVLVTVVYLWVSSIVFFTPFTLSGRWYRDMAVAGTMLLAASLTIYAIWATRPVRKLAI